MNRRRLLTAAGLACLLSMAGCATVGPPLPPGLISGRLSVQVAAGAAEPARQLSGSFELRGDAHHGQLDLISPIGLVVAQARWQPGRVELLSGAADQGPSVFANLGELSKQAFGEALPLEALFDWLRGRPWPGAVSGANAGGFEQLGWQVDTTRFTTGQITARRLAPPAATLRVLLEGPL